MARCHDQEIDEADGPLGGDRFPVERATDAGKLLYFSPTRLRAAARQIPAVVTIRAPVRAPR